jgi:hypothetical protein
MRDRILRVALGAAGVLALGYGALRLIQQEPQHLALVKALIGSLLLHDVLIAPAVIGIGWLLARFVPPRARAYAQAGLVTGGLILSVGAVLIWRQGKYGAKSLALLQQNYLRNVLLLLGIVLIASSLAYAASRLRTSRTKLRPPADQHSEGTSPTSAA